MCNTYIATSSNGGSFFPDRLPRIYSRSLQKRFHPHHFQTLYLFLSSFLSLFLSSVFSFLFTFLLFPPLLFVSVFLLCIKRLHFLSRPSFISDLFVYAFIDLHSRIITPLFLALFSPAICYNSHYFLSFLCVNFTLSLLFLSLFCRNVLQSFCVSCDF